jgi:hypothetical protein
MKIRQINPNAQRPHTLLAFKEYKTVIANSIGERGNPDNY